MNRDAEYFKKLSYDVILRKKGKMFVLFIPELSCLAEDESIEDAYKKLEAEKEKYFKEMIELDLAEHIGSPERTEITKSFISTLMPFIAKCAIVCFFIFLTGLVVTRRVSHIIHPLVPGSYPSIVRDSFSSSLQKIDSMSEEEKEKVKLELQRAVQQLKPFVDEVKLLWQDPRD